MREGTRPFLRLCPQSFESLYDAILSFCHLSVFVLPGQIMTLCTHSRPVHGAILPQNGIDERFVLDTAAKQDWCAVKSFSIPASAKQVPCSDNICFYACALKIRCCPLMLAVHHPCRLISAHAPYPRSDFPRL